MLELRIAAEPYSDKSPSLLQPIPKTKLKDFRGNSGWQDQAQCDGYAVDKMLPFLPGADLGEKWAIGGAAEDEDHPEYAQAVTLMLRAAKAANVCWITVIAAKPDELTSSTRAHANAGTISSYRAIAADYWASLADIRRQVVTKSWEA